MFWILACIVSFLFILYEIQFRWKYRSLNRYPGPVNVPFIGSVYYYFYSNRVVQILTIMTSYFGSVVKIQLGYEMMLIISDPEMLEFVLRSPKFVDKSYNYKYLIPWLGKKGIFISPRKEWHKNRKFWTPAFHFSILEEYAKMFHSHCDVFIDVLNEVADSSPVDIYPKVINYTLDIISETALAIKMNCQRNSNKEFLDAMHFLTHMATDRSLSVWKRFDFLYKLSPNYKTLQKYLKLVYDITNKVIENRRKILSEKLSDETDLSDSYSDERKKNTILIDLLLKSTIDGQPISDDVIKTEVNSIIFGGHDTTASAISIMMYALASHKEVQNKVVEELKDIFGDDRDRPATMQDLGEMRYMELVIKETMRFYPVAPLVIRQLTEDVDYNGTIIPEGTNLVIFMHGVHRSSVFDRPKEFIPERFLSTNYIKPYTFIPFSAGPRNCLGQKYAMLEIKVTFSKLLRHFEFESAGRDYKMDLDFDLVMKPVNGIYVKIKPRDF